MEGVKLFESTGLLLELLAERTDKPKLEFAGRRWFCTTSLNGTLFCGSSKDGPLYAIEDLLKQLPEWIGADSDQ